MSFTGTVVNGTVVLDGPARPPNGARVDVLLTIDDDDIGAPPDIGPHGNIMLLIREAHEDVLAGRTRPVGEAKKEIRTKLGLPRFPKDE